MQLLTPENIELLRGIFEGYMVQDLQAEVIQNPSKIFSPPQTREQLVVKAEIISWEVQQYRRGLVISSRYGGISGVGDDRR